MTTRHNISLNYSELVFTIDNILSYHQTVCLINQASKKGFHHSSISGGGHGRTGNEDPRTNKFCVMDMPDLASELYQKIRPHIEHDLSYICNYYMDPYFHSITRGHEWVPHCVCERMRIYKYDEGDTFPEHIDYKMKRKVVERNASTGQLEYYTEQSFLTLLIYLNDDFTGGQTGYWPDHQGIHCRFLRSIERTQHKKDHQIIITPKTGMAVVQYQNVLHEGLPPANGTKFILRTDIIYRSRAERHRRLPPLEEEYPYGEYVGPWERLFESSCKNYAD